MPTLDTVVVFLLIVYLHPNGVVRVCWEPSATDDPFMVLLTRRTIPKNFSGLPQLSQNDYAHRRGPV